jgi:hypothetical protein
LAPINTDKPSDSARAKSSGTRLTITVTEPGGRWNFNRWSISEPGWHFVFDMATVGNLLRGGALHKTHAGLHVKINRDGNGAVAVLTSRAGITTAHMIHALEFLAQDREDANAKAVHAAVDEPVRPINHQIPALLLRASPVRLAIMPQGLQV